MDLFMMIVGLLALIGASNVLSRIVPSVPVPLFQIGLGALLAAIPTGIHLELEPELFFVLFIAPLLFNDGMRMPRDELWKLRGSVLALAVGLVFATVVAFGYAIHAMIPSIPLSAAFALAAILSPTDAVAVSALSSRVRLPKGILRMLEGEALLNDASGLVAFKFAVAATVTGAFSLAHASFSFVVIAAGGLLCGVILSMLRISVIQLFLRRLGLEDVTLQMLIQLLTPFLIYLVAEEIGVSGILAVVGGGLFHAFARDKLEPYATKLQVVSNSTWSVIVFILNGLVFLLLGLQLPEVAQSIFEDPTLNNFRAIGYAAAITVGLYALRFVWVYVFDTFHRDAGPNSNRWRTSLLTTLSGVRGAVTLAGAFSIPLALADGGAFPERDLIIFLSAGVILFTLLVASVALPLLAKDGKTEGGEAKHLTEKMAQTRIIQMAIRSLREEMNDENRDVMLAVLSDYNRKLNQIRDQPGRTDKRAWRESSRRLWGMALRAEREKVEELEREGAITPELARAFDHIQSHTEALVASGRRGWFGHVFRLGMRRLKRRAFGRRREKVRVWDAEKMNALKRLKLTTAGAAMIVLREAAATGEEAAALPVLSFYQESVGRLAESLSAAKRGEAFEAAKRELELKGIQMERDALQKLYADGEVSLGMMNNLRFFINTMEASISEEEELE